jgi:hypothetical protein
MSNQYMQSKGSCPFICLLAYHAPKSSRGHAENREPLEAAAVAAFEEPLPQRRRHGSAHGFEYDGHLLTAAWKIL